MIIADDEIVKFDYLKFQYLPKSEECYWVHKPLKYDLDIIQCPTVDPIFNFVQFVKRNPFKNTVFLRFVSCTKFFRIHSDHKCLDPNPILLVCTHTCI